MITVMVGRDGCSLEGLLLVGPLGMDISEL